MKLVGISGTFGAGKDIGAEYLVEEHGFTSASTGDMVRKIAQEKYDSIERHTLHKAADEARHEKGAGIFVEQAIAEHSTATSLVVTGIRSIGEAKALKAAGGLLLFVDAPREMRFKRTSTRKRTGDEKTFEEFVAQEDKELLGEGDDEAAINLNAVRALADHEITNDGNLGLYLHQLEDVVGTALGLEQYE